MTQENIFLLDSDKTIVGVLSNRMPFSLPFYDDLQERSLDDLTDTLSLTVPANHSLSVYVTADKYLLYPDLEGTQRLYKIKEVNEVSTGSEYYREVYAEISAQDDLIKSIVRPSNFSSATLEEVMEYILTDTDWEVGEVEDFGLLDYKIEEYTNALEALISAVKAFGGELNYEYEVLENTSSIVSQKVSVYQELGEDTGKFFTHGKDVVGVERLEDTTKLVTALIGVGKANDQGVPLTFSSLNPTVPEGYEKPIGADWVGSITAQEEYGGERHIFGVYKDDEAESPTELFNRTLEALKKYERPLMTYKVTLALLEKLTGYDHMSVRLGDTIVVQDESVTPALYVKARVRKLSRSITNPLNDGVELGDYIPIIPTINQSIELLQQKIRLNEVTWNEAKRIAEDAKATADTANSNAITANNNASTAISTANTAKENAGTALSTANTAKENAGTALSTANSANATASTALNTATSASNTANSVKGLTDTWVFPNKTTINGHSIETGTVTANKINVNTLSALSANLGTVTAGTVTGVSFSSKPLVKQDAIGRSWTEKTEIGINGVGFKTSALVSTSTNEGFYAHQETVMDNDGVLISNRDDKFGVFSFTSMSGSSIQFGGTTSSKLPYGQHFINGDGDLTVESQYKLTLNAYKDDIVISPGSGKYIRLAGTTRSASILSSGTVSANSITGNTVVGKLEHNIGYFIIKPYGTSYEGSYDFGQLFFDGKSNEWRFNSKQTSGALSTTKLVAGGFNTSSSIKYKENIQTFSEDALSVINTLDVKTYNLIGSDITERRLGLIIEDGVPEPIVTKSGDSIDLYAMSAYLWKAVQQLTRIMDAQQQSIEYLAEEVEKIKGLINV